MRITLVFLFIGVVWTLQAQQKKSVHNDIGINVTSLLSEVIGIGNQDIIPNFNLTYRRTFNNKAFRISAHAGLNKDSEINVIDNSELTLDEKDFRLRLGFERHTPLSQRFMLIIGLDVVGLYQSSYSNSSTGFENDVKTISAGAGPALRLEYRISERISLMTESTLYFITGNKEDVVTFNGQIQTSSNNAKYSLTTQIPSVLFLNVHF